MGSDVKVVSLFERQDLINQCADLLNSQWRRSKAARVHSLEKSLGLFPVSLILLECNNGKEEEVIGHSRICMVLDKRNACWVESVVVKTSLRGKGFGKLIMKHTEEYARRKGFDEIYLSTHDKQKFYSHLGYNFCEPVVTLGGASHLISSEKFRHLRASLSKSARNSEELNGNQVYGSMSSDLKNTASETNALQQQKSTVSHTLGYSSSQRNACNTNVNSSLPSSVNHVPSISTTIPPPPPVPLSKPNEKSAQNIVSFMMKSLR